MQREKQKRSDGPHQLRVKLHVLGAAGHVTGSLNLLEVIDGQQTTRILIDVGLHQEDDGVNFSHRLPRGIKASDITHVVMSHLHIDHTGYYPRLIKDGFTGFAYTHAATLDCLRFLLPDSGRLQEMAADRENERNGLGKDQSGRGTRGGGKGKAQRVYPLYTMVDGRRALKRIKTFEYDRAYRLTDKVSVKFTEACHVIGAAVVTFTIGRGADKRTFCFTGNIGRNGMPFLKNLAPVAEADYVMSESTYGNKLHDKRDRLAILAGIVNEAYQRARRRDPIHGCGVIVIPAFAVGRVQTVLYDLRELMAAGRIPAIPVFLDSPMAVAATKVHRKHVALYNDAARRLVEQGVDLFATPDYAEVKGWSQSKLLDKPAQKPIIIIGSSGMAAGGRILQHIEKRLPRKENTILFVGYQGTGFLGHTLVNEQPKEVVIHGKVVPVNASIQYMSDYSGHADYAEIIAWLKQFKRKPKKLFLVHGETDALSKFKEHIQEALPGWNVIIPGPRACYELVV